MAPSVQDLLDAGAPVVDLTSLAYRTAEITAACQIAGTPELAQRFLSGGLSVKAVRKQLLASRVEKFEAKSADGNDAELETQFLPNGEPQKGAANNPNRLMDAVKRRIAGRTRGSKT